MHIARAFNRKASTRNVRPMQETDTKPLINSWKVFSKWAKACLHSPARIRTNPGRPLQRQRWDCKQVFILLTLYFLFYERISFCANSIYHKEMCLCLYCTPAWTCWPSCEQKPEQFRKEFVVFKLHPERNQVTDLQFLYSGIWLLDTKLRLQKVFQNLHQLRILTQKPEKDRQQHGKKEKQWKGRL